MLEDLVNEEMPFYRHLVSNMADVHINPATDSTVSVAEMLKVVLNMTGDTLTLVDGLTSSLNKMRRNSEPNYIPRTLRGRNL